MLQKIDSHREEFGSLSPFIENAKVINKIRNKVAVHPTYVDLVPSTDEDWKLRNSLIAGNICILVKLLMETDPTIKTPDEKIRNFLSESKVGEFSLEEVLEKNFMIGDAVVEPTELAINWGDVLKPLALRSYKYMKEIAEGLYG